MNKSNLYQDKELFSGIAQGEDAAYRQLFSQYFDRLKWYAFKLLKSEFWAEEIVQEVFIHLWTVRDQLPSIDNPSAYLYKMTGNRCLDRIRRQELEMEMQYVANAVLHGTHDSYQISQYDLLKIEQYVREAVESLPDQRRLIYRLQQEEGLSYAQIAERLDISRHTVRNQMAKTLQTIRRHLLKKGLFFFFVCNSLHFL